MKTCVLVIGLILFPTVFLAAADPTPEELLARSDLAFMPTTGQFTIQVDSYTDGALKNSFVMDCFLDGSGRYLLTFTGPAPMRGQSQLRLGDTIYNYVRKLDKLSQVSAKLNFYQSVLSQEDVMNTYLSNFYSVETVEKKTDDSGKVVYSMELKAKQPRVAYARIVSSIDAQTFLPIERSYYAQSGQLIKVLRTEKYEKTGSAVSRIELRVTDALRPDNYAIVTTSNFDTTKVVPSSWFTIPYMKAAAK